jgi:hypothetical protein
MAGEAKQLYDLAKNVIFMMKIRTNAKIAQEPTSPGTKSSALPIAEKIEKKIRMGKDALKHWENLEPILQRVIVENNESLPSESWLDKNGYKHLIPAIRRHHGGIVSVRDRLGLKQLGKFGKDSLRHWENLEPVLRKIIADNGGELPGSSWLHKHRHDAVISAILKHHGGFREVRMRLGLKLNRKDGKYALKHWENLEPVLRRIIEDNGGMLPGQKWLHENGHDDINAAISKHHGGYAAVREKLRELGILKDQPSSSDIFQQLKGAMDSETIQ